MRLATCNPPRWRSTYFSWGCDLRVPGRPPSPAISTYSIASRNGARPSTIRTRWPGATDFLPRSAIRQLRPPPSPRPRARYGPPARPHRPQHHALARPAVRAARSGPHCISLPCLAGGAKAFRLKPRPNDDDWLVMLRGLERAATIGLERLHSLERHYRDAQRTIAAEYRPGALPALLALIQYHPCSPRNRLQSCFA